MNLDWLRRDIKVFDDRMISMAKARQERLTKPSGSLGALESLAVFLAGAQGREKPQVENIWISIFAGDHGVTEEGVSAFPQAVTAEMIKNFSRGGAAVSVLARHLDARLEVIDLGTVMNLQGLAGVIHLNLGPGTGNFVHTEAMSETQLAQAMEAGRAAVERACVKNADVFIGGEMGIGNTTAATAVSCALLGEVPLHLVGSGTGLDAAGISRKAEVIAKALLLHGPRIHEPIDALQRLGGFEIAALAGAYLSCAQQGIPVLVDGFISTAAALAAEYINPGTARWYLYAHGSAEKGHARLLSALKANPLLDLDMRLGEASGAGIAVPLLQIACRLHNEMATFEEASVSGKM